MRGGRYTTKTMTGHWFAFFAIQPPILAVESLVIKLARKQGCILPRPLSIAILWTLMLAAADLFFFPPLFQTGLDLAVTNSIGDNVLRLLRTAHLDSKQRA